MKRLALALALISIFAFAASALADDLNPPPWRGQPGTTFAEWDFQTDQSPIAPVQWYNPFGMPLAYPAAGVGQSWQNEFGGRQGVWPLSGTIEIPIQNYPPPNPYKDIRVQVTWAKQTMDSQLYVSELLTGVGGQLLQQLVLGPTGVPIGDGLWYHSTYNIRLYPNPANEVVKISGTVMVDQLVIDTICVPEPSSLAALSGLLGIAGLAWRRRR